MAQPRRDTIRSPEEKNQRFAGSNKVSEHTLTGIWLRDGVVAELQQQLAILTADEIGSIWTPALHAWMRTLTFGHALERV